MLMFIRDMSVVCHGEKYNAYVYIDMSVVCHGKKYNAYVYRDMSVVCHGEKYNAYFYIKIPVKKSAVYRRQILKLIPSL